MHAVNRSVWLALLVLAAAPTAEAAGTARKILVVQTSDQAQLTYGSLTNSLKAELSRRFTQPVDFVQFTLALPGFREAPKDSVVTYLRSLFAGQGSPDLIVSIGAPAAQFVQKYGSQLFPGAPALLAGVDVRFVQNTSLPANVSTVAVSHDPSQMIDNILRLLPDTTHLFVVVGASSLEQSWREVIRREASRYPQLTLDWATGSLSDVLQRSATLPAHSAVLYALFNLDAQGAAYDEEHVLAELHAVATAPLFGFQSSQLGHGIVGGPLMSIEDLSHHAADAAVRMLNGEAPGQITTAVQVAAPPTFDWRELRRWRIDESRLPSGSLVRLREPTPWERTKWLWVSGGAIGLVESLLIAGLVINLRKRRRTERSLRESEARFRRLADTAPVMIWMSGTDKLCTDVNRSWLDFTGRPLEAELGEGWTASVHVDDLASCVETYSQAFDRREAFRLEYRLRRSDGEYRSVLDCGVPRFDPEGSFCGYVGSVVDVTDQKAARAALSGLSRRLMKAQEEERARVARDLHDDVCQQLGCLVFELDLLKREDQRRRKADLVLAGVLDLAQGALRSVHDLSLRLHPAKLRLVGLVPAIRGLVRELSRPTMRIAFSHDSVPVRMTDEIALCVFRVVQEALQNVIKHSAATQVSVQLRGGEHELALSIVDNGVGFNVDVTRASSLGLLGMQERLRSVGGRCDIRSRPSAGTTVDIVVPMPDAHITREATTSEPASRGWLN
jgi:PAS domain S-box-containing protein